MDRDGLTAFYHKDGLGSITKLSDISQNEIASYTYDVFGSLRSQTGSINNPYLFTSRRLDIETGLYYYRARYYNSNTGRFISRDPLLYGYTSNLGCNSCSNSLIPQRISGLKPSLTPQNLHPYVYVTNNPVNLVDPLGLCGCSKSECYAACKAEAKEKLEACKRRADEVNYDVAAYAACMLGCAVEYGAFLLGTGGGTVDYYGCVDSCTTILTSDIKYAFCYPRYWAKLAECKVECSKCPNP